MGDSELYQTLGFYLGEYVIYFAMVYRDEHLTLAKYRQQITINSQGDTELLPSRFVVTESDLRFLRNSAILTVQNGRNRIVSLERHGPEELIRVSREKDKEKLREK